MRRPSENASMIFLWRFLIISDMIYFPEIGY